MEYTVVKVTSRDDLPEIEEFVHDNFQQDMPLFRLFGLEDIPPPRSPTPREPTPESKDFHVKAVDPQGTIIGVAINRVNVDFHVTSETPPQVKKMIEFMSYVEEDARLDKLPDKTIELRLLSVHREWRQRGVARRLAEESMRVARDSGLEAMRICCTSEFSARLARSLGWREHYRLAYRDYPRVSGSAVYLSPTPPHEYLCYYVTDL